VRRILLVEHEEPIATMLSESLTAGGCEVEVIADGNTAVDRLQGTDFDLIIIDLLLPDDGVLNVVHALHRNDALAPVLVLAKRDGFRSTRNRPPGECR
jgi:DNA-binding response OmpR family regulator